MSELKRTGGQNLNAYQPVSKIAVTDMSRSHVFQRELHYWLAHNIKLALMPETSNDIRRIPPVIVSEICFDVNRIMAARPKTFGQRIARQVRFGDPFLRRTSARS